MENVRSPEFTSMGPWQTSVNPQLCGLTETNVFFFRFCSGRRKKRLLVRDVSISPFRELIVFVSSAIIEDIEAMRKAGLASLAFFYCDFRDDRKMELRGLLTSFLVQLYHQSDSYFDILSKFYLEHDKGSRPPSDGALVGCLMDQLKPPGLAPVHLIVDGLDECPNPSIVRSHRAKVLNLIEELVKIQIPNLRVCVTSRPEPDIKNVFDPLIFRSLSLHDEGGQKKDIEDYIKSVINTRTIEARWNEGHRKLAFDVLAEKSNGMYDVDTELLITLAHFCDVGLDGWIVSWSTFVTAPQQASGVH